MQNPFRSLYVNGSPEGSRLAVQLVLKIIALLRYDPFPILSIPTAPLHAPISRALRPGTMRR